MGLEGAQEAVRNAAVAARQARQAAIPVGFTRHVYRPGRGVHAGLPGDPAGRLLRGLPLRANAA